MYFNMITSSQEELLAVAHEQALGAYREHQWLWRFFPAPEGSRRKFLFRRSDVAGLPRFYVVSENRPVANGSAWNVQSKEYAPRFVEGDELYFELRANPVITVTCGRKSQRHDVVMQEKKRLLGQHGHARWQEWQSKDKAVLHDIVTRTCTAWLIKRAERLGFKIDEPNLWVDAYQQHREGKRKLQFSSVDFSGMLTVSDPEVFVDTLFNGIGHAKAFGCGLLLVKRKI